MTARGRDGSLCDVGPERIRLRLRYVVTVAEAGASREFDYRHRASAEKVLDAMAGLFPGAIVTMRDSSEEATDGRDA